MTEDRSCLIVTFRKLKVYLSLPFQALFIPPSNSFCIDNGSMTFLEDLDIVMS